MLGLIDVRRPQVADQQLIAAEDIERQKAVVVIIAVEKATLLAAVHRIVRTIEVQHQFLRRVLSGSDEALHQRLMRRPSPAPVRRPLQTANRRGTGQTPIPTASRLQHQIVAQNLVVVDVFIAKRNGEHPLAQQTREAMLDLACLAPVRQTTAQPRLQSNTTVRQTQQQRPAVR